MLTQKLNTKLKVKTWTGAVSCSSNLICKPELELMLFSLINNQKVWQPPITFNLCNTWLISAPGFAFIRGILIFNILFYFVIYLFFLRTLNVPVLKQYLFCVRSTLKNLIPKDTAKKYYGSHLQCTYHNYQRRWKKLASCSSSASRSLSRVDVRESLRQEGRGRDETSPALCSPTVLCA